MDYQFLASAIGSVSGIAGEYIPHFLTALIIGGVMSLALFYRDRRDWKQSQFGSRLNISLNIISNGRLRIRTLQEAEVKDVVISSYARSLIKKAARVTSVEDPFLHFADEKDGWMVYNEILNAISELYGPHFLTAAIKGALEEDRFLMAITWERDSEIRIQKLRVLLIQEDALRRLGSEPEGSIVPEVPVQRARVRTLRKMHERFQQKGWPPHQTVALPRT